MIANNGGKVSNLIVGPTQSIPFATPLPWPPTKGAPLLASLAAAFGDTLQQNIDIQNTMKKKTIIARNYKILHEASTTLAALRDGTELRNEMLINQIQVHLVDGNGDGIVFCLEYDEVVNGELNKTFHSMEEYYGTEGESNIEVELYDDEDEDEEFEEFVRNERKRREPLLNWNSRYKYFCAKRRAPSLL